MTDMIMEIQDDMRAAQLKAFWERFGQWIIGLVLAIIVATAAGVLWRNHVNNVLTEQSGALLAILQNEADTKETPQKLEALSRKTDLPLRAVVDLYRAQKMEQAKDLPGTQKIYQGLMDQHGLPIVVQNLARVQYARLGIVLGNDAEKLLQVLAPVTADEHAAFYPSAQELKGLLLMQQGKQDEANKIFTALSSSSEVPGTLRARAKSMIHYGDGNAQ